MTVRDSLKIRKSTEADIKDMMILYESARNFMVENGNPNQWVDGYPKKELLLKDIATNQSYVCEEDGQIIATFVFLVGVDPTYLNIYKGEWLNSQPYGVVHRITSSSKKRGLASYCLNWCFEQCGNLRIDTHRDNLPMQKALEKNGYQYCGVIHLENGDERIAFQKCRH